MEAAIRHLRDGAQEDAAACPTCCVLDQLDVIGGGIILRHAVHCFTTAMRQRRSQATSIRLVDLTGNLSHFTSEAAEAQGKASVEVIDLFSDPWGWRAALLPALADTQPPGSGASTTAAPQPQPALTAPFPSLASLRLQLLRPPGSQVGQDADAASAVGPAVGPAAVQQPQLQPGQASRPAAAGGGGSGGVGEAPGGGSGEESGEGPVGVGMHTAAAGHGSAAEATGGGGGDIGGGGSGPGGAGPGRSVCVVIGCLSTLMERYGEMQALALLEAVQRSPLVSCVLTSLHKDMHPENVLYGVRRLCSCTLELSSLTALQAEVAQRAVAGAAGGGGGGALAGRLDCRMKRRTGRLKVESELYSLLVPEAPSSAVEPPGAPDAATAAAPSRVSFFPLPPFLDAPDPRSLVNLQPTKPAAPSLAAAGAGGAATAAAAPGAAPGAGAGGQASSPAAGPGMGPGAGQPAGLLGGVATAEELARAVGSSMRLTLTEEERRAKEQVVLPYQHTGLQRGAMADAYAAGDHRAYLPPAAGGSGPAAGGAGQQALGHILYVRDSASEADSDQDLDEDLDI